MAIYIDYYSVIEHNYILFETKLGNKGISYDIRYSYPVM